MDVQYLRELAARLASARSATADLNIELGRLIGYTTTTHDQNSGGTVLWLDPGGSPTRLPLFTHSIDAARMLAERLLPRHVAAVSWGFEEQASARINDGPICFGATEAIALCGAALTTFLDEAIRSQRR